MSRSFVQPLTFRRKWSTLSALFFLIALFTSSVTQAQDTTTVQSPSKFEKFTFSGWDVYIEKSFGKDSLLRDKIIDQVDLELAMIDDLLPEEANDALANVTLLVYRNGPSDDRHTLAYYSVEAIDTELPGNIIVIPNAKRYYKEDEYMDLTLLHEFAHAYERIVLHNPYAVKSCYDAASAKNLYEGVLLNNNNHGTPYLMKNEHEYFAELSCAYWNRQSNYPFVRSELKDYDPEMYEVIDQAWQDPRSLVDDECTYDTVHISGFTVYLNQRLNTSYNNRALENIYRTYKAMTAALNSKTLAGIQQLPIRIEYMTAAISSPVLYLIDSEKAFSDYYPADWLNSIAILRFKDTINDQYTKTIYVAALSTYLLAAEDKKSESLKNLWNNVSGKYATFTEDTKIVSRVGNYAYYFVYLLITRLNLNPKMTPKQLQQFDPDGYSHLNKYFAH